MAVRQYIGARYIPKFMGEWNNTTNYEALSIVEYNNSSYTSKIPVPAGAGNPATATQYWALSGNTSGQIEEIRTRLNNAEGSISSLDARVSNVEARTLRKALYIGNSYTTGYGSTSGNSGIYALTKHIFDDATVKGIGGADFVEYNDGVSTTQSFGVALDEYIANPTIPLDEITDIIFISAIGNARSIGAHGKSQYYTLLVESLKSIKSKIASNFPNAKHVNIYNADSRCRFKLISNNIISYNYESYSAHFALEKACATVGLSYKGWIGFDMMYNPIYFYVDKYHPSDSGYSLLSNAFLSVYDNGKFESQGIMTDYTINDFLIEGLNVVLRVTETPARTKYNFISVNNSAIGATYSVPTEAKADYFTFNDNEEVNGFMPLILPSTTVYVIKSDVSLALRDLKKDFISNIQIQNINGIATLSASTFARNILTGNKADDGITGTGIIKSSDLIVDHIDYI